MVADTAPYAAPRQRLGLLQHGFTGQYIRPQASRWHDHQSKKSGFPAIRKADIVAAALRAQLRA